ncbi:MAG: biopolymer transporter ExbB [Pseudomonadota bacterium]
MAQGAPEAQPHFSQPVQQIFAMIFVLGLSSAGVFVALPRVLPVFQANPYLNGFIVVVFAIGVISCFWMVLSLINSVRWIEDFAADRAEAQRKAPQLLASLASLLRSRGARMQLSSTSTQSILDSVATRIDEGREITRYIVNTLIFLGLLGTFYGLATTVPAVVDTIRSLAPQEGEGGVEVFNRLMTGLEAQLGGMGVAFASSLLGLAGSLIVGLLELFAGRGQNRFYRELEEWLSSITRVGLSPEGDGELSGEAHAIAGVIDHLADQMESLQAVFSEAEASRDRVNDRLGQVAETLERMAQITRDQSGEAALERVAAGQERLIALFEAQGNGEGIDAESRMRLRSIDVQMLRILEEISAGRQESMAELRTDISALAQALSQPRGQARKLRAPQGDG